MPPESDLPAAVEALSSRLTALELLVFALADRSSDPVALRTTFETYAAGIEAKMNALPVSDRHLELLRESIDAMRQAIP